jgi:class 3 adenylate cyclase
MQCPQCRHENSPRAKFCEECATPLVSRCRQCGADLPATAKFCPECAHPTGVQPAPAASQFGTAQSYTPKHLAEKILTSRAALETSRAALEGERKQVTVLFADLKGSMELLADRDPEEARKLLDPVLEHMMEAVHRYEGTGESGDGDGIMALFGAPLAHEDHTVRACYAALRMQESVKRYAEGVRHQHGIEVQIRVGLNSGEVVVRAIGSDLHMDYTAVGQTTHLAARMEQLAAPGTVRLTAGVLRLAEGYVVVKAFHFAWAVGAAYHRTGRRAEGIALMEDAARGVGERHRMLSGWASPVGALGGAYLLDRRLADATRIAQEELPAARQRGKREVEGHLLRLLGDIAAHPDRFDVDTAEAHYRQALGLAGALGLRLLVAHCHLGLGKLYRRAGKPQQAREHITTATTMFGEMDMRFWREQADAESKELV